MSRFGLIVVECESRDCYEAVKYGPSEMEEFLSDLLSDDGWTRTDDKDYCPACSTPENPRERGDDDGVEYAHPGDRVKGLE